MKKVKQIFLFCCLFLCLCYGHSCIAYSYQALTLWFETLIPSLFVTMVVIRQLYKQQLIQHIFPSFFCSFFGLDSSSMALVVSSMLLGFPNGSQFIEEAYQNHQLTKQDAQRLFLTCCFPTPGFVILTCGAKLFSSIQIGWFLYLSQILCGFCLLFCTRKQHTSCQSLTHPSSSFMNDLASSMKESGFSLFMIGGYLMIFMSISGIFFALFPQRISLPLRICSEFSSGVFLLSSTSLPLLYKFICTSLLLGFGGFCVHMQIYSLCETSKTSYPIFFCYRILQSILSTIIFCIFLFLFV